MSLPRTFLSLLVAVAVTIAGPAPSSLAAPDYRGAITIAYPAGNGTWYSNDYANPRSGGRVHRATDIFGAFGTRIFAAQAGRVVWLPTSQHSNAGWAIQILGDDGRTYAYYHLGRAGRPRSEAIAARVKLGARVARGQYIGRLGDSGNAAGGAPHLHFEIHDPAVVDPYGGTRRDPYASLRKAQGLPVPKVTTPSPTATTATLRRGDRGEAVRIWQRRLNRVGDVAVRVDGHFGAGTQRATVAFQRSAGLGPAGLGVVGPKTRAAMNAALKAARSSEQPARDPERQRDKPPRSKTRSTSALRLGDTGRAVARWQRQLNKVRNPNIGVDGQFGPGTHRATVAFQRSAGLGPAGLGVVGPQTRAAMKDALQARRSRRHVTPKVHASRPPKERASSMLRLGDTGRAVARWQRQLNKVRNPDIGVDGQFGPGTHRATVAFQRSAGLGPGGLGVVGPNTRAAMGRALRRR